MTYVCDSCGHEIESVTEDNRCPECRQRYVFDPTQSTHKPELTNQEPAQQSNNSNKSEREQSRPQSEESDTEQDNLNQQEEEVIWSGANA